jgi:phytoene desaturase
MGKDRNVIIIGAGIGGIATSIRLALQGYKVIVFEKNSQPGGRCGHFEKEGHRFDTGATFLMMPEVYRNAYAAFGKEITTELDLHQSDPIYRVKFNNGIDIRFTPDLSDLQQQLELIEPGSYNKFLKLLHQGHKAYQLAMKHVIDHNYTSYFDKDMPRQLYILFRYNAFANHYKYISRKFSHEALRDLLTFQNLYLGQNPRKSSGIFFFMPFMELTSGVYYPKGGMYQIIRNMVEIARDAGVAFQLDTPVTEIRTNKNKAEGVVLNGGTFIPADIVIANADLPYVYDHLIPQSRQAAKISRMKYACSAIVYHWGVNKVFPGLEQHNVFVSDNHKETFDIIFKEKRLPREPAIYVHSPVRSDPSAAPPGQDSMSAIVHVGHVDGQSEDEWIDMKKNARKIIIRRLEQEGMTDFEKHIKFEVCHAPKNFQSQFNLTRGAVFGSLAHNVMQMAYFRPGNRHNKYHNLYFVGGSTQPGGGMPLSLLSAKLVTERITNNYGKLS